MGHKYHFGFNGKENDNEVSGSGNTIAFEARIYDSRLGRFLSRDPLESAYVFQSTYVFAGNSPTWFIDLLGMGASEPENETGIDDLREHDNSNHSLLWNLDESVQDQCQGCPDGINSDLLVAKPSSILLKQASDRVAGSVKLQPIEGSNKKGSRDAEGNSCNVSDIVNLDYYSARIDKMPVSDGVEWTAEELFQWFRQNHRSLCLGQGSYMEPYSESDGEMWASQDFEGVLMTWNMRVPLIGNVDDGTVIAYNVTSTSFIFAPVTTLKDGTHPVAGNREFGIVSVATGSGESYYEFNTRAADRIWGLVQTMPSSWTFNGGDRLWTTLMLNMSESINLFGGESSVQQPQIIRASWEGKEN